MKNGTRRVKTSASQPNHITSITPKATCNNREGTES